MKISIPSKKVRKPNATSVPPKGEHASNIVSVEPKPGNKFHVQFGYKAEGRNWTIEHVLTNAAFLRMLQDCGCEAGDMDTDDLIGLDVPIQVITRGNRSSAEVARVGPA